MTFIGKETFREGNIWLEGGGGGLPFSPFLYAYTDDGGSPNIYTKVDAPPVPVSADLTWFGFTYQEDLSDTFTSADGDPSKFSLTVADVTARGGAFIDYGDGNGPVSLDGLDPGDLVGFAKGTSDDFPDGSSVTWSVLDADMTVIGERTISFGTESGAFQEAVYGGASTNTFMERIDERPVVARDDWQYLVCGCVVDPPATVNSQDELVTVIASSEQMVAAGGLYFTYNNGLMDLQQLIDSGYGAWINCSAQLDTYSPDPVSPVIIGCYRDSEGTQPVFEASVDYTVTHVPQPYPTNFSVGGNTAWLTEDGTIPNQDTLDIDWGEGAGFVTVDMVPSNYQITHNYSTAGDYHVKIKTPDPYYLDGDELARVLGNTHVSPATFAAAGSSAIKFTVTTDGTIVQGDVVSLYDTEGLINEAPTATKNGNALEVYLPVDVTVGDRVSFTVMSDNTGANVPQTQTNSVTITAT